MSMNLRHAVALALVGWYLMTPPTESCDGTGGHPCRESPLRNWTTEKTFNSASACNKARASNYEKFKAYLGNEPRNTWWEAVLMQDFSAKCIASDDPRLKGK